jgi:hypothetical protein
MHLGDQRAGRVDHRQAAIAAAPRPIWATPWALKMVMPPGGTSSDFVDEMIDAVSVTGGHLGAGWAWSS